MKVDSLIGMWLSFRCLPPAGRARRARKLFPWSMVAISLVTLACCPHSRTERALVGDMSLEHRPLARKVGVRDGEIRVRLMGTGEKSVGASLGTSSSGPSAPVASPDSRSEWAVTLYVQQEERPFRRIRVDRIESRRSGPTRSEDWVFRLPEFPKGTSIRYYLEAQQPAGAMLRLPEGAPAAGTFACLIVAAMPLWLAVADRLCLWGAFFLFVFSTGLAVRDARGPHRAEDGSLSGWAIFLAAAASVALFLGCFPLSWLRYQETMGHAWGPARLGLDHPMIQAVILLVYWAGLGVLLRSRLTGRGEARVRLGPRALAIALGIGTAGVLAFLLRQGV